MTAARWAWWWRRLRCWLLGHPRPRVDLTVGYPSPDGQPVFDIYRQCPRCHRTYLVARGVPEDRREAVRHAAEAAAGLNIDLYPRGPHSW